MRFDHKAKRVVYDGVAECSVCGVKMDGDKHEGETEAPPPVPRQTPPEALRRNNDPSTAHEAIAAYEPKRSSAKGRVLALLRSRRGQWIDAVEFTAPEVGGFAGTRRLRELRDAGHPIETQRKPGSNTWQHRLPPDAPDTADAPALPLSTGH